MSNNTLPVIDAPGSDRAKKAAAVLAAAKTKNPRAARKAEKRAKKITDLESWRLPIFIQFEDENGETKYQDTGLRGTRRGVTKV